MDDYNDILKALEALVEDPIVTDDEDSLEPVVASPLPKVKASFLDIQSWGWPLWVGVGIAILVLTAPLMAKAYNNVTAPPEDGVEAMFDPGFMISPPSETADEDAPVYDPGKRSYTMDCAPGSESVGIYTGYSRGEPHEMRLCALPITAVGGEESTPGSRYYIKGANQRALVSAPASYNYVSLVQAAKKRNIDLRSVSSFRTNEHQRELWDGSDKTGRAVARPGYSNHQQGAAIDFYFEGASISMSSCKWRVRDGIRLCTLAGNRTYEWLHAQSHKHGLRQYYAEFWHFSPDGR